MPSLTVPVSQEKHVALLQLVQRAQSDFGTIHQIICKTSRATKVNTRAQLLQSRRIFVIFPGSEPEKKMVRKSRIN